jgi:hypothetical protein
MSGEERAARGARARGRGRAPTTAQLQAWRMLPVWLEQRAKQLIDEALKAPVVASRANGQQMNPKFTAGLKLLELAEKYRAQLARSGGAAEPAGAGRTSKGPVSIADYGRRRNA